MGNKMCKKKTDTNTSTVDKAKGPSPFDRIFSRFHLKPKSWKSDSQLDRNKINRYEVNPKDSKNGLLASPQTHSKSSDWTNVDLEVPETNHSIASKNPQLSFIFSDNTTPTPPPRKHKKTLREKIESVAKNSFNALQSKKPSDDTQKLEADEVVCVKKTIKYGCPACENRESCIHKKHETHPEKAPPEKEKRKSLSVVSLPNYDGKFSLSDLKYIDESVANSANSLPNDENNKPGRFENYMTRCRSFGSLLNNKLRTPKKPSGNESDDSFGGLEDWDFGIIEHYKPKDASLPRPRKPEAVLSDIEQLIIPDEEVDVQPTAPIRPLRRSESLVKEVTEAVMKPEAVSSEHSSLMRILQEFTVPETEKWVAVPNVNEDFIKAEKVAVS